MMSTDKNGTSKVSQPRCMAAATDKETEALAAVVIKRFPCKLHDMLVELDEMGLSHIVSFQPHGRAFKIHKVDLFVSYVLPKWFRHCKYSSFQRQLNIYDFKRINWGPDQHAIYHENFLRGQPDLAQIIPRNFIKGPQQQQLQHTFRIPSDPNFYAMPALEAPRASAASSTTSSSLRAVTSVGSSAKVVPATSATRLTEQGESLFGQQQPAAHVGTRPTSLMEQQPNGPVAAAPLSSTLLQMLSGSSLLPLPTPPLSLGQLQYNSYTQSLPLVNCGGLLANNGLACSPLFYNNLQLLLASIPRLSQNSLAVNGTQYHSHDAGNVSTLSPSAGYGAP